MPHWRIFGDDKGKAKEQPASPSSEEKPTRPVARKAAIFEEQEEAVRPAREQGGTVEYPRPDTSPNPNVASSGGAPKTKLYRPGGSGVDQTNATSTSGNRPNPMDDPVVGWLVIVGGPGKGASCPLGYGMNSIGRAADSRVSLDFGDEQLSRSNHAVVIYDPRGRKFFLQHGGGINLTYVDNAPVMVPMELSAGQEILLGNTRLRFMPFCGAAFDWQDA